jgi:competence protein ComEA
LNCYARVLKRNSRPRNFGCVIDRRKAEIAGYAVAAFVLVLLVMRLLHHDQSGAPAGARVSLASPGGSDSSTGGGAATTGEAVKGRMLVVDVAGEVRRPGVYRVPPGSRVDSAVQQAGGVTRRGESAAVNLAMPLQDGQQIVVPRRGVATAGSAAPGGSSSAQSPGAAPSQPISLSMATVEQLDTLDGIGPTLAGRIVEYREAHGGFRSIDELRQVDGIGDKRFAALREAVQP